MASGTLGADEPRERHRWGDSSKVYRRKNHKGLKNNNAITATVNTTTTNEQGDNNVTVVATASAPNPSPAPAPAPATTINDSDIDKNNGNTFPQQSSQTLATEDAKSSQQQQTLVSDHSSDHNKQPQVSAPNGCEPLNRNEAVKPIITKVDNKVRIDLGAARSKNDIRELRKKLVNELDQVRSSVKKLEAKEVLLTGYSTAGDYGHSHYSGNDRRALARVNSEVGSVGNPDSRIFRQLSVSVSENNHGVGDVLEKEKRTPKANQYYRNSEFLLGKDRLPPAESNKKLKSNGGKKYGGEIGYGFGMDKYTSRAFKSCNNVLSALLKLRHSWVFNKPVDAKALGLHDYHDIIKHPMDLGTIKSRLSKNWYKSPREFAEDVRLTFHNAMTYNPKGQDVHTLAEEFLNVFEEKWAAIESEYNLDWRYERINYVGLHTPTSRKVHPPHPPLLPVPEVRNFDRTESMAGMMPNVPVSSKPKRHALVGRPPAPKKPKVNDPHKRDMTYEEKQKLSTHLQGLPLEKLDNIVQIIKRRNSALSQQGDEIEVDIDTVDAETLWELDRFVINYKKSVSKNKRRAELALQARGEDTRAVTTMKPAPANVEDPKQSSIDDKNAAASPAQGQGQGNDVSSSSSSSSDSGSSSSDSDSDSSSADGSDAGHSPRT